MGTKKYNCKGETLKECVFEMVFNSVGDKKNLEKRQTSPFCFIWAPVIHSSQWCWCRYLIIFCPDSFKWMKEIWSKCIAQLLLSYSGHTVAGDGHGWWPRRCSQVTRRILSFREVSSQFVWDFNGHQLHTPWMPMIVIYQQLLLLVYSALWVAAWG